MTTLSLSTASLDTEGDVQAGTGARRTVDLCPGVKMACAQGCCCTTVTLESSVFYGRLGPAHWSISVNDNVNE